MQIKWIYLSQYDEKYHATLKKAVESGILNNTNKTHDFVDLIAKISADKNVTFDFTDNQRLKDSGFAIEGKTVNGYITESGDITVNINSAKALNRVVGHEVTHVLEGTEFYDILAQSVTEYAKSKGEYDTRLETLTKLYEVVEGTNVEAELVADLVGDYVFTDADFVRKLSVENRNVFQKIYDEIKYLCKVATAGSKEVRQLEKVKKTFAEVYRESNTAQKNTAENSGVRYSISKTSKMPYDSQLQMIEKGQMNGSNSLYIGVPGQNLQNVGFSKNPFAMNQGDYRKSRRAAAKNKNYSSHAVPFEFFENMPKYLSEASLFIDNGQKISIITDYAMNDTRSEKSFVIAGVWSDQPMENDTINQIKSIYPLDDFTLRITKAAEEGKLVIENKSKVEKMLATIGIQPAEVSYIINLAKGSLSQNGANVNTKKSNNNSNNLAPVKKSLSEENSQSTQYGDYNVSGKDIMLEAPIRDDIAKTETVDDVAPVKESVSETESVNNVKSDVMPKGRQFSDMDEYFKWLLDEESDSKDIASVGAENVTDSDETDRVSSLLNTNSEKSKGKTSENRVVETVEDRIAAKLEAAQTALENNRRLREESAMEFDNEIAHLQKEYEAKKNKNTKVANNILRRSLTLPPCRSCRDWHTLSYVGEKKGWKVSP